jgi:LuxR family maltose regulon positive regulatory protein
VLLGRVSRAIILSGECDGSDLRRHYLQGCRSLVEKPSAGNRSPVLLQQGLLRTKLYVPPARPNLVPRPRLVERLNQAFSHKLTLISAPPGFGKTTLLTAWVPQSRSCVAWLSLDAGDNDPVRFWVYLIATLQTLNPGIGANALPLLQTRPPAPIESVLTTLLNEIDAFPSAFAVVLDDYHLIEAQPLHHAITFLMDHLPPQMHLVITTRADPPMNLSQLRARAELIELRASDLRFTTEEVATFLNEVMQLGLAAGDIAALEARTEGWIAGLQLAALSMRGRDDLSDFIGAFTGSHRFILDYLMDQVLQIVGPSSAG